MILPVQTICSVYLSFFRWTGRQDSGQGNSHNSLIPSQKPKDDKSDFDQICIIDTQAFFFVYAPEYY